MFVDGKRMLQRRICALLAIHSIAQPAGWSDLDRGLIGTLLNGYETRYLKKNLRGRPRKPDEGAMARVGSY